jgi:hypothetical protein
MSRHRKLPHRKPVGSKPGHQLWIGLADVVAIEDDLLHGAKGAYVHVVASSHNDPGFRGIAREGLRAMGFDVINWGEIMPYDPIDHQDSLTPAELHGISTEFGAAANKPAGFWCGTFHLYEHGGRNH